MDIGKRGFLCFDFVSEIAQNGIAARFDRRENVVRLDIGFLDDFVARFFCRLKRLFDKLLFGTQIFQSSRRFGKPTCKLDVFPVKNRIVFYNAAYIFVYLGYAVSAYGFGELPLGERLGCDRCHEIILSNFHRVCRLPVQNLDGTNMPRLKILFVSVIKTGYRSSD